MYCRQCGEELNNPRAVICVKCGTNKGQGENYCPDCGQEVKNKGAEVCLNCGIRLKGAMNNIADQLKSVASKSGSNNNNKMVAGLLAVFLFAIAMFLFAPVLWGCWIWAIIDAVQIFTGKMNNANGLELV
mgnify:CR=1 FL=1